MPTSGGLRRSIAEPLSETPALFRGPAARRSRAPGAGHGATRRRPSPAGPRAGRSPATGRPGPQATHGTSPGSSAPIGTSSTPATGCARRTCRRRPSIVVHAPGHGWSARTCRSISTAGRRQSIQPSARRERPDERRRALVLRRGRQVAGGPALELGGHDLRREVGQLRIELGRGLAAGERHRPLGHDRSGVELLGHDHQRHAALLVAGQDGARHRGRAAVPGQQRGVDVEGRPRAPSSRRSAGTSWPYATRTMPSGANVGEGRACLVRTKPRGRQDPEAALAGARRRSAWLAWRRRPAGRSGWLTTSSSSASSVTRAEQRDPEGPRPEEGDASEARH